MQQLGHLSELRGAQPTIRRMNELRIGDIITEALEREDLEVTSRTYDIQTHERTIRVCYTRNNMDHPCFTIRIKDTTHELPESPK